MLIAFSTASYGQSTFGTILGTVTESSGAVLPGASVTLVDAGTSAIRSTTTDGQGNYQFVNLEPGNYELRVEAKGFEQVRFASFELGARETRRITARMIVASQETTVLVDAESPIQTDTSSISETKGSKELIDLPVAITSRASGSTSPLSTLTAQPGVQTDASGNISVAGTLPTQLSVSIDGISSMGPATQEVLGELFPSFNAIEEIRISQSINPAEYGGVSDITTISKAGTNSWHGGAFENLQNSYLNASNPFSQTTPSLRMNNFGFFGGGPLIIPRLYNGHDKTFFFASYEALRLPKQAVAIESVPTAAMRNGDLSAYSDPLNGYSGNIIPQNQLSPYDQKLLALFFPLPNYGPAGAISNNYLATFPTSISSNQGDLRIDENLTPQHQVFARLTYKSRSVLQPPYEFDNATPGSPLLGSTSIPEIDEALTAAWNWVATPSIVNELRAGFSELHSSTNFGVNAVKAAQELGLTGLPGPIPAGDAVPGINIAGFVQVQGQSNRSQQGTRQVLDTVTWSRRAHTLKFGADYRYLTGYFANVFANLRLGSYTFNGSVLSSLLGPGAGTPLASFLLGYPDSSSIATVLSPDSNSYANHYAFFAQDDWKATRSLTLNFGLRYEYHPMFRDRFNNLSNFLPDYMSSSNGQSVTGAVVIPIAATPVNAGFAQSIAPTPILTAAQAGIPKSLRYSSKLDFAPRVGFAWRMFGGDKTVLRGGYGKFIESLLASGVENGWGVQASDYAIFGNAVNGNGSPTYSTPYAWPSNIAQPGVQSFYAATNLHYQDPYVQEWDLTVEQVLAHDTSLRVSYDGNHSANLGISENLNELAPNTVGYANTPSSAFRFPLWQVMQYQTTSGFSNYHSATVSAQKRLSHGFQFQSSYIFARNLSNTIGNATSSAPSFATEQGGTLSTPLDPGLDYGNVPYTRKHRFLNTFLYELPFGPGKAFLTNTNPIVNEVVGRWELGGVLLFQSGPFMTVVTNNDPSGTGYNQLEANGGRADIVPGVSRSAGRSVSQWVNPAAFAAPPNNIGRFGNSPSGVMAGPGSQVVSTSLIKTFSLYKEVHMQIGAQVSNLLNHPNYAPPGNLTVGVSGFGALNSVQSAEGAGPRAIQLTGRVNF